MRTLKYTFWQDGEFFLGFLNDYPDHWTQGTSKEDLEDQLKGLLTDLESDWYMNLETKQSPPVLRHNEIDKCLAKSIIKKLTDESSN